MIHAHGRYEQPLSTGSAAVLAAPISFELILAASKAV
jgi:hypothetical protein